MTTRTLAAAALSAVAALTMPAAAAGEDHPLDHQQNRAVARYLDIAADWYEEKPTCFAGIHVVGRDPDARPRTWAWADLEIGCTIALNAAVLPRQARRLTARRFHEKLCGAIVRAYGDLLDRAADKPRNDCVLYPPRARRSARARRGR